MGWTLRRETAVPVKTSRSRLRSVFDRTVEELVDGHDAVAVRVSGGMDSAAVLSSLARIPSTDVQVIALVTEAIADSGERASEQASRIVLSAFRDETRAKIVVLPSSKVARPAWSAVGPRLEAAPGRNAAAITAAAGLGATLMLSGDGADELLTSPAFLGCHLARASGSFSLLRYLRDHGCADIVSTAIASASELLLRKQTDVEARVYYALISSPAGEGETVLDPTFAAHVRQWSRGYDGALQDLLPELLSDGWAHAEAHLSIWPQDQLHLGSEIPVRSPFLEQPFVGHALGLPLWERWNAELPTPYLRRKAAVAALLEPAVAATLPPHKKAFSADLAGSIFTDHDTPALVDLGLVRASTLVVDTATVLTLRALEDWVRGALHRGYEPARS
jgi:asparagine synthase (glutamine-hydrolysing)